MPNPLNQIAYPSFDEMYPNAKNQPFKKRLREHFRYVVYSFLYRKQCKRLIDYLNAHPLWIPLFQRGYGFTSLLRVYCDKRFNAQQRLETMLKNLDLMVQYLGETRCRTLLQQQNICLSQLTDNLRVNLSINYIDSFEGFFSINLRNQDEQRIYDASFTLLEANKLLIASIQGPRYENAAEVVKQATKELHGIRPMFMLMNVFREFAQQQHWQLLGIPHRYQGKNRLSAKKDIVFNYDEFWRENEGELTGKYWALPTYIERKSMDEIASKKRSMYRKRYDMLDQMHEAIRHYFA